MPDIPDDFDESANYRVRFRRTLQHGGIKVKPSQDVVVTGAIAEMYRHLLVTAEKVG